MATKNNPTYAERPSCEVTLAEAVVDASVLIAVKADALAYLAKDVTGARVVGVGQKTGIIGGKIVCNADVVLLKNDGTNPLTQADIGGLAYVHGTDGETVCAYAGSTYKLVAGKVVDVVTEGVHVDTNVQSVAGISAAVT